MKKIISLLIFACAMSWTWSVIHSSEAIGFETHSGIQLKFVELIESTLEAKKPNAKDLAIHKIWTEALGENKVKAIFEYSFLEESEDGEMIEQFIGGEAVLYREPSEQANVDKWVLQSVETTNDAVVFTEGSTITPGDEETPENTPPSEEKTEEKKASE